MNNKYVLGMENEFLQKLVKTEQFKISSEIIKRRFELEMSLENMAEYLKLSPEDYIEYEYGSDKLDVEKYQNILNKMGKISNKIWIL